MRDLVFISAGLDLDGGGRAAAGRLLAASCASHARERGCGFSIFSLGKSGALLEGIPTRCFAGRQSALALAVWRRQLSGPPAAYVYDLLGPARLAGLPGLGRAPYLVSLLGIEVWRALGGDRRRALDHATIRLAISAYTARRAREANPGIGPIDVLPLCLEERAPAGTADEAVLDLAGEGYVLIVGRMASTERYKGHDPLLDAMPGLLAERPGLRLVIAGDGDDRPRLERRAAEIGLSPERAVFTGFVSEATLAALYQRAAVFAMPSRGEGFGLVYLEAMRAGKPCLAARDAAAAEIVVDGETGLLVDPGSVSEIAEALGRLLDEPDLARRLGEAGRRRFQEFYTPERYRAGLEPFLDRLTAD